MLRRKQPKGTVSTHISWLVPMRKCELPIPKGLLMACAIARQTGVSLAGKVLQIPPTLSASESRNLLTNTEK